MAQQPRVLEVSLGHREKRIPPHGEIDHYELIVEVENKGPTALQDYKVQIDMPELIATRGGNEPTEIVETETGRQKRWEGYSYDSPNYRFIYPREKRTIVGPGSLLHIAYQVPDEKSRIINVKPNQYLVVCRLFSPDMDPLIVGKPINQSETISFTLG